LWGFFHTKTSELPLREKGWGLGIPSPKHKGKSWEGAASDGIRVQKGKSGMSWKTRMAYRKRV